jgi:hypothetical protein
MGEPLGAGRRGVRHSLIAVVFTAVFSFFAFLVLFGALGGQGRANEPSAVERAYRAGKAAGDDGAKRLEFQRGIDLARATLAAKPDDPDALLWLSANLAGEALTHGKMAALHVVPEVEASLLHLERVAPTYNHAAGARGLANLYWKAPSLISVGSSKKAESYFGLALSRAPEYPGNQAMAAAFYADRHDCGRAAPLADAVLRRGDLDSFGADAAEWRKLATQALKDCR